MLDKYNYHHNQYSYHAINRVIIIASHGLRAGQLRDSLAQPGIGLGPIPNKVYWLCLANTNYDCGCWMVIKKLRLALNFRKEGTFGKV